MFESQGSSKESRVNLRSLVNDMINQGFSQQSREIKSAFVENRMDVELIEIQSGFVVVQLERRLYRKTVSMRL